MSGNEKINPVVKTTTIGVKVLREISVYPLSVGEQLKLGDVITEVITKFVGELQDKKESTNAIAQMENVEFVEFILGLIKDNVVKIITIATDEEPTELLDDMTNEQFLDFVSLVYDMNFGGETRKKLMALIQKVTGPGAKAEPKKAKKK